MSGRVVRAAGLASFLIAGLGGCAPEFDQPSVIDKLRVLAVQKDKPFAKPGDDVTLSILFADGSSSAPRGVQVTWAAGCFNPPGDLFQGCVDDAEDTIDQVGEGTEFTFTVPEDVISEKEDQTPGTTPFSLGFVFFTVCAGVIGDAPAGEPFPAACFSSVDGPRLGPNDFVAGFSQIFVYEELTNANPIVTGVELDGRAVTPECIGAACNDSFDPTALVTDCGPDSIPCVESCPGDGSSSCTPISFKPIIDENSAELDDVGTNLGNRMLEEQMWVSYFADSGAVDDPARLLNDAITGWNEDFGTDFFAPAASRVSTLWAVAHDNRGGVEWLRLRVFVKP